MEGPLLDRKETPTVLGFRLRDRQAFLQQRFTSLEEATEALPEGAYTTFRTWGGGHRVLRLRQHLDRLEDSSRRLGHPGRLVLADVAASLRAALLQRPEAAGEARVRLTLAVPRLFATLEPFDPRPLERRREGVACATVALRRHDALCKDTRFAAVARHAAEELPEGAHEGLMLAEDGAILEGLTSNFFAVAGGTLRTEGERVLPGLTRALVLELARERLPVSLEPIRRDELRGASECFLSSSSRGILPVVRVDADAIADGRPGPVTRELMAALDARIEREAEDLEALAAPGSR